MLNLNLNLEPHDHTPESAQREFYPDLQPSQIALYAITYTHVATWHGETEVIYLWLPRDEAHRANILDLELSKPCYMIIAIEEE